MTHRCLNCFTPMYEGNHTDGLFCFKCGHSLNILTPFYMVIKGLNELSGPWLKFRQFEDQMTITFAYEKATLNVVYDLTEKSFFIYIEFMGHMVYSIHRKTVTMKALRKILTEHNGIFGNKNYEE